MSKIKLGRKSNWFEKKEVVQKVLTGMDLCGKAQEEGAMGKS